MAPFEPRGFNLDGCNSLDLQMLWLTVLANPMRGSQKCLWPGIQKPVSPKTSQRSHVSCLPPIILPSTEWFQISHDESCLQMLVACFLLPILLPGEISHSMRSLLSDMACDDKNQLTYISTVLLYNTLTGHFFFLLFFFSFSQLDQTRNFFIWSRMSV